MTDNLPTAARIRELLSYDESAGLFRWVIKIGRAAGKEFAGATRPDGYVVINVDGRSCRAHQLAWLYVRGEWPSGVIDHINRDRSDNRIANLRLATRGENMANTSKRAGRQITGVRFAAHANKYMARLGVNGKTVFLGYFLKEEEANRAYQIARRAHFGEFAE
jgi:hypothetical protein